MKSIKKILYGCFLILFALGIHAQKLDSLMQVFNGKSLTDSEKLKLIEDEHIYYNVSREASNNPDKAIEYITSLHNFIKDKNDKISTAITCDILGAAYTYKGEHFKGLDWFLKSLEIRESINDTVKAKNRALAASHTNIGEIYLEEKIYDKAHIYFLRSKEFSLKAKNNYSLSLAYINMGNLYIKTKKFDKAEQEFFNGINLVKEETSIRFLENSSTCYSSLGDLYFETGRIDKSITFYNKSLDSTQKADNLTVVNSYIGLGNVYKWKADSILKTKQTINRDLCLKAAKFSTKALKLAQKSGFLKEIAYSSKNLYDIYKTTDNVNKALEMHEVFVISNDSLNKLDAKKEIFRIEYNEQFEKEKLKNQLVLKEKAFKRNILIVLVSIVFIGVLLYFVRKNVLNKNERKRLLNELNELKSKSNSVIDIENEDKPKLDKEKIETFIGATLNPTDWQILNHLYENPSLTAKELGEKISLSTHGIYSSLKKMYGLFDLQKKNENQRLALVIMALKISGHNYFNK